MRSHNPLSTFSITLILTSAAPVLAIAAPSDAQITADLMATYDHYAALRSPNDVRVQTLSHVVYLTGLVDTGLQRQTAELLAREIPGVERVVDSLAVSNQ